MKAFFLALAMLLTPHPQARAASNPWHRPVACVPHGLIAMADRIAARFHKGPAFIVSGYRSPSHNRAVHGARHSYHLQCRAVDFSVVGVSSWALFQAARKMHHGGIGHYAGRNFIHIDDGPRREWRWGGKRNQRRVK